MQARILARLKEEGDGGRDYDLSIEDGHVGGQPRDEAGAGCANTDIDEDY